MLIITAAVAAAPLTAFTVCIESKSSLKAGTALVEFTGSYTVEAVGLEHAGQTIEAR